MGKVTKLGLVPRDDPMFSTGPELFSRPGSKQTSTTSTSGTGGATQGASTSAKLPLPPVRAHYKTQAQYDEAMNYWQGRVGKTLGLALANTRSRTGVPAASGTLEAEAANAEPTAGLAAVEDELPPMTGGMTDLRARLKAAMAEGDVRSAAQAWLAKLDLIIAAEAQAEETGLHFNEAYEDISPEGLDEPLRSEVLRQLAARRK